jgi:NTE family protein
LSGGGAKGIAHIGVLRVIEELGIPIDYIGGASMGSIVGGLVSLGYTSKQLEEYIANTDWNVLLTDKVGRRHISIYEKGEKKKYWLQFSYTKGKIGLPLGLLTGQNVMNLFTELTSPAYRITEFNRLPVPFLCTATDIATGEEVVLENGNLAQSMRASMAIPSVFTPEEINGRMLFDGGLTNNFPANKVEEKGMEILIGVDVTSQSDASEFNNIYSIMEQVVFMSSLPLKERNKQLCKLLIIPNIPEYNASSFSDADSLLVRGERAAREHYRELKELADYLHGFSESDRPAIAENSPQPLESFHAKEIKINGLKHTSKEFFLNKLGIDTLQSISFSQLNTAIDHIRGTQVFASVTYQLHPLPDGTIRLQFDCVEQSSNLFRVGLNYDKEYKASLLLNLTLRNVILDNSKALVELSIGENPELLLSYSHSPGIKPLGKTLFKSSLTPDWRFYINTYKFDAYNYSGNARTDAYDVFSIISGVKMLLNPALNTLIGGGFNGDYVMINTNVGSDSREVKSNYMYLTSQFFYELDTYNEDYFPTAGAKITIEGTYNKGLSKNVRFSEDVVGAMFRSDFIYTPLRRWTIYSGISAGSVFGSSIPPQYLIYLGGTPNKLTRNNIRFTGMHFMQKIAKNAWVAHFNNQIRLWNNIYFVLRTNLAKADDEITELFTPRDFWIGGGISLQYNSVVGPLGVTFSSSNAIRGIIGAINVGFWF